MRRRRRRNPAQWAHGAMRYGHRLNPGRITRRKARLILHHGEVRGHPLTGPQRRFFGARASGYPYRRNPFGGVGVGTLALLGGAAFVLLTPQGRAMLSSLHLGGGPAPLPPGYTTVGSNLYRGPDGALYARNPYTGAMVKAPAGAVPTSGADLLAKVGIALIPTVGSKVADWLGGLFSSQHSATTVVGDAGSVASGVYVDPGASPFPTLPPIDYSLPELPYSDYAGVMDYSMPLDVAVPDLSVPDPSYFYPQVDYSIPDVGGEWAGFFGLGASVQSRLWPRMGLMPGLVPLPFEVEWRGGPQHLRRPASRL